MSRMMPFLDSLCQFVEKASTCVRNVIRELAAVYPSDKSAPFSLEGVHIPTIFEDLGKLLTVLITLDSLVNQNAHLRDDYGAFRRSAR